MKRLVRTVVVLAPVVFCVLWADQSRSQPVATPYELLPGDQYRIAFVTTEERAAFSADINEYNDFVTDVAHMEPALVALGASWRVVGSTETVDARDNTNTNPNTDVGLPIYLLDGLTKIADDNADLWDGSIDHPLGVQQNGQPTSGPKSVNTGTYMDGTGELTFGHVTEKITTGTAGGVTSSWWIDVPTSPGGNEQLSRPFYALSSDLTVPKPPSPAGSHGNIERLSIKGDPAVDGNGTLNGLGSSVALNDQSQVLYSAAYTNTAQGSVDEYAVVRHDAAGHIQMLRGGTAATDGNGIFRQFTHPKLNNDGAAAFYVLYSQTSGGTSDDRGVIVIENGGVVTQIAREASSAPGGDGTFFIINKNSFPPLQFNDLAQVALSNELTNTSAGQSNNVHVMRGSSGAIIELAREGQATPSGPGTYANFSLAVMNQTGAVAFHTNVTNLSPGSEAQMAIVRQDGALAVEIARAGQPAPDGNGTVNPFGLDNDLAINGTGEVAFAASFKNTTGGTADAFAMLRGDGTSQRIVARAGEAAPDGNGVIEAGFHAFGPPKLSEFGEVAFLTEYSSTANLVLDDNAIVKAYANDTQRDLVEVVREGWSLPGGDGEFFNVSDPIDVNEAGVVSFTSSLRNLASPPPSSPLGVYLGDGIDIVEVTRTGAIIDGYNIFQVAVSGYGIAPGSLNRHGQVAFSAQVRQSVSGPLSDAVYLFTPDLYWRGGTIGAWEERRTQLGDVNDHAMKNWTLGLTPAAVHDVIVDRTRATAFGTATPFVEITGPNADVTVKSLVLREATHLALIGSHTFTALDGTVLDAGRLSGSGELVSAVDIMPGGSLQADGLTVEGDIFNEGQLGVVAAAYDYAVFAGAITNKGDAVIDNGNAIASTGTFNGNFTNNGALIVGLNQTAEFVGDYYGGGTIENDGTIVFHGLGPGASPAAIEVQGVGTIELAAAGETTMELGGIVRGTFHGDSVAQYDSVALVEGALNLGGMLTVELISPDAVMPVFSPSLGDTFTLFEADQLLGSFAAMQLPDLGSDLDWTVLQTNTVFTLAVVEAEIVSGDFDGDGDVDGRDFLIWQRNLNVGELVDWQANYGAGLLLADSVAVPEPAAFVLLAGLLIFPRRSL